MENIHSEDYELIQLSQAGDEQAFQKLYSRYKLPLFSYLHKLLPGRVSLVEDIFQMVWIKAVNNFHKYQDQQKLLAWLCRIAHNLVIDYFRNKKNRDMDEIPETVSSDSLDPEMEIKQQELSGAVREAITQLSEEQQEIIQLRMQGISFKEIAEQQKISLNTALSRMHYAVQNLRKILVDFL
ncbi:MAG: sigma-70 family RNA polymerase sigma factor [Lentisphaeria bacterium]